VILLQDDWQREQCTRVLLVAGVVSAQRTPSEPASSGEKNRKENRCCPSSPCSLSLSLAITVRPYLHPRLQTLSMQRPFGRCQHTTRTRTPSNNSRCERVTRWLWTRGSPKVAAIFFFPCSLASCVSNGRALVGLEPFSDGDAVARPVAQGRNRALSRYLDSHVCLVLLTATIRHRTGQCWQDHLDVRPPQVAIPC